MEVDLGQTQIYWCRKCQSEALIANANCPNCGRKMQTKSQIKSLGKLLVFLGVLIVVGSGLGVLASIAILLFAKNSEKDTAIAFIALAMCGAITTAGITAIIGGLWQSKHGRTSKMFMWIFYGLIVVFLVLGQVFYFLKD